jgi:DNA-directed RNA polymerase subunit H (RpoH/RPB5)/DNA-directed RNA polymerase subunit M/transcription elongation factor TFIIS
MEQIKKSIILFNKYDMQLSADDIIKLAKCIHSNNIDDYMNILYEYIYLLKDKKINIDNIVNDLNMNYSIYNHYPTLIESHTHNTILEAGIYYCGNCHSPFTDTFSRQIRGADEGETAFVRCYNDNCKSIQIYGNQKRIMPKDKKKINEQQHTKYNIKNKKKINIKNHIKHDLEFGREMIFNIIKTVYELLNDRGYHIPEKDMLDVNSNIQKYKHVKVTSDKDNFQNSIFTNDFEYMTYKQNNLQDKIIFYYRYKKDTRAIGIDIIRKIIDDMKSKNITTMILCSNNSVSSHANRGIAESGFNYTIYKDIDLIHNITQHKDSPKYNKIDDIEKQQILKLYNIDQLPIMSKNDPISKYYGTQINDIFFINRGDKFHADCTYRIVK